MPIVSVVIPLHNKVDYVRGTIQSVLEQQFADYEIIVVDDGSDDGSTEIAQTFASTPEHKLKYVRQERQGAGAARNRGMALAEGELIAFLDADDLWSPQKLGLQVRFMEDHPEIQWCGTNFWFDANEGSGHRQAVPFEGTVDQSSWIVADWFSASSRGDVVFQTSGVVIRRSLIERVGEFDVTIPSGQDFDYWVRTAEVEERCGYCLAPCYKYRRHAVYSITSSGPSKYAGKVGMLAKFIGRAMQPGRPRGYAELIKSVSEQVARNAIAQGHPSAARAILRNFPARWRGPRHVGYTLLTYVPVNAVRFLGRFFGRRSSRRLDRSTDNI